MDYMKSTVDFFDSLLSGMKNLGVWPSTYQGVRRTEDGDRESVDSLLNKSVRYVAVSGNIKAGKSTLLNQLLFAGKRKDVLPSDPTPETAKITFIESVPESEPEGFEVVFYSRKEWDNVCAEYSSSKVSAKFENILRFSKSMGAHDQEWIGHAAVWCSDFQRLPEYVSCHSATKESLPGIIRGKYVPYVREVHIRCHSEWLSQGTVIVDTPGLADPNPINRNQTLEWIGKAVFVVYVHSVSDSENMDKGQKKFIAEYLGSVEPRKIALVANFFDDYLNETLEDDEWSDEDVADAAHNLVQTLKKESVKFSERNIFPFSARNFREDERLDPYGFFNSFLEMLKESVTVRELAGHAANILFQTLRGHLEELKMAEAEYETRVRQLNDSLDKNKADLKKLEDDEEEWKRAIENLQIETTELFDGFKATLRKEVVGLKSAIHDDILIELEKFSRSGELAAGLRRVVSGVLETRFSEFNDSYHTVLVNRRDVHAGSRFKTRLVGLYNRYIGAMGEPLRIYAIENYLIKLDSIKDDVYRGSLQKYWTALSDDVDSFWSFYRTNFEKARDGVKSILHDHVFGEDDCILKSCYDKPYDDMRKYALEQIKLLAENRGKLVDQYQQVIQEKEAGAVGSMEKVSKELSEVKHKVTKVQDFFNCQAQARDALLGRLKELER